MQSASSDDRPAEQPSPERPLLEQPAPVRARVMRRLLLVVLVIVGCAALAVGADWYIAVPKDRVANYVGRQTCAECHADQVHAWTGSHHDLAMDLATDETVLADFNDTTHTYQGLTSKMFRRDGGFYINTEGPDGQLADFQIRYVIGVEPLQQYMVEFDDGRIQVLRETWDTERKRWYYLYPTNVKDERLASDDPLHWTGQLSNWNFMCADCHTTNLKKNYDIASDSYHTTFGEMDVSCETCHGPGSIHVELANSRSLFWDRNHGYGLAKLKDTESKNEIESCAKCHMRRSRQLTDDFRPGSDLCNHFAPAVLRDGLYHADGQINDEVYVYGSFLQSKMHAKGIRCTDCHDPHTTKLKQQGNLLCTSCHQNQHPAQKYDTPAHHHHKEGSAGAQCVECHMPEKHYMVVDPRRDHSFRVPRPDLSVELRTPNACTSCHLEMELEKEGGDAARPYYADWLAEAQREPGEARNRIERLDRWSLEHTTKWYGERKERRQHFAHALVAARRGDRNAEQALVELVRRPNEPAIVRATALRQLGLRRDPMGLTVARKSLDDKSPLVRAAALSVLQNVPVNPESGRPSTPLNKAAPLLNDQVRLVRIEAARALVPYATFMTAEERSHFDRAATELEAAHDVQNDSWEDHREQAIFYSLLGKQAEADESIAAALRLSRRKDHTSDLHYRRAMFLVTRREIAEAEQELRTALETFAGNRNAMRGLVALYVDLRRFDDAVAVMKLWHEQYPNDAEVPAALRQIEFARQRFLRQQNPVPIPRRP